MTHTPVGIKPLKVERYCCNERPPDAVKFVQAGASPSPSHPRSRQTVPAVKFALAHPFLDCNQYPTGRSLVISALIKVETLETCLDPWASGALVAIDRRHECACILKWHDAQIALLIEKREAKGLTQTDPAEKLGEYQSFVARLESGQRRVDVIEFLELSDILGFDPVQALCAAAQAK